MNFKKTKIFFVPISIFMIVGVTLGLSNIGVSKEQGPLGALKPLDVNEYIMAMPFFEIQRVNGDYSGAVQVLLESASVAMGNHAFTTPLKNNAFQLFRSVLLLDPSNIQARKGIENIKNAYIELLDEAVKGNDTARIQSYYHRALGVGVSDLSLSKYENKFSFLRRADNIGVRKRLTRGISGVKHEVSDKTKAVTQLRRLGQSHQKQKMFNLAIPVYEQLVKMNDNNSNDWLGLAVSLDSSGQAISAKDAYVKVVELQHASKKIMAFSHRRIKELSAGSKSNK